MADYPTWVNALVDLAKQLPLIACATGLAVLTAAHLARLVIAIAAFFVELIAEDLRACRELWTRLRRAATLSPVQSPVSTVTEPEPNGAIPPGATSLVAPPRESPLVHAKRATLRELRARSASFSRLLHLRTTEGLHSEMIE